VVVGTPDGCDEVGSNVGTFEGLEVNGYVEGMEDVGNFDGNFVGDDSDGRKVGSEVLGSLVGFRMAYVSKPGVTPFGNSEHPMHAIPFVEK